VGNAALSGPLPVHRKGRAKRTPLVENIANIEKFDISRPEHDRPTIGLLAGSYAILQSIRAGPAAAKTRPFRRCNMNDSICRLMYVGVVMAIVLVKSNPTAEQHRKALHPQAFPGEGIRSESLGQRFYREAGISGGTVGRPLFEAPAEWNDYKVFSTTTDMLLGTRRSFGILGHVFDLRTPGLRGAEEQEAKRASLEELSEMFENIAKPRFQILPVGQGSIDYSSRGCVVEGDAKP
jgi:hypothetical protein